MLEVVPEHAYWQHRALLGLTVCTGVLWAILIVTGRGQTIRSPAVIAQIYAPIVVWLFWLRRNPSLTITWFDPRTHIVRLKRRTKGFPRRNTIPYDRITAVKRVTSKPPVGKEKLSLHLETAEGKSIPCTWSRPVTPDNEFILRSFEGLVRDELALPVSEDLAEIMELVRTAPDTATVANVVAGRPAFERIETARFVQQLRQELRRIDPLDQPVAVAEPTA